MTSRRYDPDHRRTELMERIEDDIPPAVAQALHDHAVDDAARALRGVDQALSHARQLVDAALAADAADEAGWQQAQGRFNEADDALATVRPDLVSRDGEFAYVDRPGGRCVGLHAGGPPWRCAVYAVRPLACREFAVAGDACLAARRRVGLSRL